MFQPRYDSPTSSLMHPSPISSHSAHRHDPFNRRSHSSSPSSSSEDRVNTPSGSEPDPLAHIYIPSDVPETLAYHIYKVQAELATTPPAPALYFDPTGGEIMSMSACDIFASGCSMQPAGGLGALTSLSSTLSSSASAKSSSTSSSSSQASWSPSLYQQAPALSLLEPRSKRNPSWFASFTEGIRMTDPKRSAGHALDVIRSSLWNYDGYVQLVQWLCWKAAAPACAENKAVVLFTRSLVDKFGKFAGQEAATTFLECLDQALVELCQTAWDSKTKHTSDLSITSAIRLLHYMGQLHAQRLIHPNSIHECLGTLISSMRTIEHIEAIQILIEASTKTLWSEDPSVDVFDFIHAFTSHTRNVSNISIRGHDCSSQEIYGRVSKVVELVNGWKDEIDREMMYEHHHHQSVTGLSTY